MKKSYHIPHGDPCELCGISALAHFVEHRPTDSLHCSICGLPEKNHRQRKRVRIGDRHKPRSGDRHKLSSSKRQPWRNNRKRYVVYIGIDGEGQGRKEHNYVLLGAATIKGTRQWYVEPKANFSRLTTEECLDFLLELPSKRSKLFSFAFNYDLTKLLTDVDDRSLYLLFRPELRQRKQDAFKGPIPVDWKDYKLNLQGTKFTVSRGKKRAVIWDLFKFFQAKFVGALTDWKVPDGDESKREALLAHMQLMKDKRSEFDKEPREAVIAYCLEECACIAELAQKLVAAHESADLELRSFYGAGSSGAAMLTAMGIKEKVTKVPEGMKDPVACAFAGGRFENSVIGPIREKLFNFDISSAYPYQLTFLPCLEHATWEHTTRRADLDRAEAQNGALVRYGLYQAPKASFSWGPFPFRSNDGSICFPIESGGGWVWLDEYLAGEKLFPHVQFLEAWVYKSNCDCKPFAKMPEYYNLRQKIGKEGAGIVIKLAMNSCYGKLAQSIGNAIFNSWIWAGMITSGTRAQLLQLLGNHSDHSDVLMMATDGLLTRRMIETPTPLFTGTASHGKPLGGWEMKTADKGMFIARPGIYFPLEPTIEEIKNVRARGVGRSVILDSWTSIVDAWAKGGINGKAVVANVSRFCGAKTSISYASKSKTYKRANGTSSEVSYGQWISRKIEMSFDPLPKRECLNKDGVTLALRRFPREMCSAPYNRAISMFTKESLELRAAMQEALEQPDGDLTDYEIDF